jgi:hypothetical protein
MFKYKLILPPENYSTWYIEDVKIRFYTFSNLGITFIVGKLLFVS